MAKSRIFISNFLILSIINLLFLLLANHSKAETLLSATFNTNSEGFTYLDDTFRSTNNPTYASGNYASTGGFSGGGLRTIVGGINATTILGMSGGWSRSFVLSENSVVSIALRYRLVFSGYYEPDECGQALTAVDGTLISPGPGDFLHQFCGTTPELQVPQNSGWQQVTINLNLAAGTHTITVGGWNNQKTRANETTEIFFDDIEVTAQSSQPEAICNDTVDNDQDGQTDCADTDCASAPNCDTETVCDDGQDNDQDGQIDCADSDCSGATGCGIIFSDDFNDGNANGWTVLNQSGQTSNWQVISGEYNQLNSVGGFNQSYHTGSYSFYSNGSNLTNYEVSVEITPTTVTGGGGGSVGVMFRYRNSSNYYRLSMSKNQGFTRLEKRVNGVFQTLAFDGRGRTLNQAHTVTINLFQSKILVYLDGEPLFGAIDSSISSGSVALYTQNDVRFDDVVIRESSLTPRVIVSQPTSFSVQETTTLNVSAVQRRLVSGQGVKFILDQGTLNEASFLDFTDPHSGQFPNVSTGDHTVSAIGVDGSGTPLPSITTEDTNVTIGVGGNYLVGMGDSITAGVGDDFSDDDDSLDGRNLNRGYPSILNDFLSSALSEPVTILNEGLGGTTSANGANRVGETITRHSNSKHWLILFGTNDSGGSLPVPSGRGLQPGNAGYAGSLKDNMQQIITALQNAGKVPLLSKVPITLGSCGTCTPFPDPLTAQRNLLIQDYNIAIDELVAANNIPVVPPDFYTYFANNQGEFADNLHPDGNGYVSMADLWFDSLCEGGILGIPIQLCQ